MYTLLLAVGVLGVARTAEAAGVLAVFVAGLTYNRFAGSSPREKQDAVDEGVNKYAVLPLVAVLGVVLPWETWVEEPSTITGRIPRREAAPAQADLVRVLLSKKTA